VTEVHLREDERASASSAATSTTRWLRNAAARLAFYRSCRDEFSREAMRSRGLDVSGEEVDPDLVFGGTLVPAGDAGSVRVGVMELGDKR
jgi:hypothetical protein